VRFLSWWRVIAAHLKKKWDQVLNYTKRRVGKGAAVLTNRDSDA